MNLRKIDSFLVGFLFFAILQVQAQVIEEDLENFNELKTFHAVEVVFIPSKKNKIEISGHSKEKVKYHIVNGRLEIKLSLDNIWSDDNTLIKVYGKNLQVIDANAGSIVQVEGLLQGDEFVFRSQEGAGIRAVVKAKEIASKAVTGGTVELSGTTQEQEVEVNTGGRFMGSDLETQKTLVSCGTAGRAEVYASEYCRATAKLGGVIQVSGNPDQLDTKTSLGGRIL